MEDIYLLQPANRRISNAATVTVSQLPKDAMALEIVRMEQMKADALVGILVLFPL